jgi:arylsulfatase
MLLLIITWAADPTVVEGAQSAQQRPNILVIWGNDIGQSKISVYTMGLVGYRTPNIDRITCERRLVVSPQSQGGAH